MSTNNSLTFLVVLGGLLLTGRLGEGAEQLDPRLWRSTAATEVQADLIGFEDGQVHLQTKDGRTVSVAIEALCITDQEYVRGPVGNPEFALDGSMARVVATGVGVDPDKALLNALSHAIEQAVGVLVDAESIIENDEIVRDQILTCTRGDVEYYQMIRRWREDGLQHARVWAVVAPNKLAAKLTAKKMTVREVPAELRRLWATSRASRLDQGPADDAPRMFEKIMEDFQVEKLVEVELVENLRHL
jgi:hypothetical protein